MIKLVIFATRFRVVGPSKQLLNIVRSLDKSLFDVWLVTLMEESATDSLLGEFVKHIQSPEKHICLNLKRLTGELLGRMAVGKTLDNIKPDVVYSLGMTMFVLASSYKKTHHATTIRNYMFDDYPAQFGSFVGTVLAMRDVMYARSVLRTRTDSCQIVCCSKSLSDLYRQNHGLEFDYIRNGVDCDFYRPASLLERRAMKQKLGFPPDRKLLVYAAPINSRKNQMFLVDALRDWKEFAGCTMVFLGDGKDIGALKGAVEGLSNFRVEGNVSNVWEYYQVADLYVSSSLSEGLPNSVMEAMSCGVPVLLSDIPQHCELSNLGRVGLLYEKGNKDDFRKKLLQIIRSEESPPFMQIRSVAEKHLSSKSMVQSYTEMFFALGEKGVDSAE